MAYAWLVDPLRRTLEVMALKAGRLEPLAQHEGTANVRAHPFEAVLELQALWI